MSLFVSPFERYRKRRRELEMRVTALEQCVGLLAGDPRYLAGSDKAFNGQSFRASIFNDLVEQLKPTSIVETGTWLWITTAYLAQSTQLPVHTCEANPLYHALAAMRLKDTPNVSLEHSDSRGFLAALTKRLSPSDPTLVYLDAHWHDDLPLSEEIEIIAGTCLEFAVMIDDFEVPGDAGYGYDDYGKGKALNLDTFSPMFAKHNLVPFFPSAPSRDESGARRGCIVLAPNGIATTKIDRIQTLRRRD